MYTYFTYTVLTNAQRAKKRNKCKKKTTFEYYLETPSLHVVF